MAAPGKPWTLHRLLVKTVKELLPGVEDHSRATVRKCSITGLRDRHYDQIGEVRSGRGSIGNRREIVRSRFTWSGQLLIYRTTLVQLILAEREGE